MKAEDVLDTLLEKMSAQVAKLLAPRDLTIQQILAVREMNKAMLEASNALINLRIKERKLG